MKAGRSPNGKGNYWAINPENYEDFRKGDFRRRRAQRRSRKSCQNTNEEDVPASKTEQTKETNEDEIRLEEQSNPELNTSRLTAKDDGKVRTFDVENLLRVETSE